MQIHGAVPFIYEWLQESDLQKPVLFYQRWMNLRWPKINFVWPLQNNSGGYQTYLALLKIWEFEYTSAPAISISSKWGIILITLKLGAL